MGSRGKSTAANSVTSQPNLLRRIATLLCPAHVALRARWQKGKETGLNQPGVTPLAALPLTASLQTPARTCSGVRRVRLAPAGLLPDGLFCRTVTRLRSGCRSGAVKSSPAWPLKHRGHQLQVEVEVLNSD
jgi:hypothetical protein